MVRKRALVVDDSKSARVILSRMLEKYDIEVDMAESAEKAIEYLKSDRPDAIFMDHLMPGMDGLQAVQAIKSDPQTAMIPIMMYTSQEGELYVGQARALGAMGVLPKQVRPVDVSKVLYELHLLPDRRDLNEPALVPVEVNQVTGVTRVAAGLNAGAPPEWARRLEAALKDQAVDLRRFVVTSLDGFAGRITHEVRGAFPAPPVEAQPLVAPTPVLKTMWPWAAGIAAACIAALGFAIAWSTTHDELTVARAEISGLTATNAQLKRMHETLGAAVKDLTGAVAALPASGAAAWGSVSPSGVSGGVVRFEPVPYGELPFDRGRLDVLREYLGKLEAQGFHGVVKLTSSAGLFCLNGNAADGFTPASAASLVNKCDVVGNPFEESLTGQQRQSLAFVNLTAGIHQRTAGAISVSVESAGNSHPSVPYPARTESLTAGEWNKAAAANNRVEIFAEPAPNQGAPAQGASAPGR
jgi:CheY-like chemotaxis protein